MLPFCETQGLIETLRYEHPIDGLRMLILHAAENPEHTQEVLDCIQRNTHAFAQDLCVATQVANNTITVLNTDVDSFQAIWRIDPSLRDVARKKQLHAGKGFSYMLDHIGQFPTITEKVILNRPDFIVCAGMSGCVIGEYLNILLCHSGIDLPVYHMIFSRNGQSPSEGLLPDSFIPSGQHCLIVEDTVIECRTLTVMLEKLKRYDPDLRFSLFALHIDNDSPALQALLSANFENIWVMED